MKTMHRSLILLAIVFLGSGCATTRSLLEIATEESVNPGTGQAVKIVQVVDSREFQIDASRRDIPSLKNNEINDPAITSRAIARKGNTYGQALGDILLPEGQTIMNLISSSLAKGLRENGFRVVAESDPDYAVAVPIEVNIEKFWGWFQPGLWQLKLHDETLVTVAGAVGPFTDGVAFSSDAEMGFQVATLENWRKTIDASLDQLRAEITATLEAYQATNPK